MKKLHQPVLTRRPFRRFILTTTILPAVLASSAFGANWSGAVSLDTSSAPEDIHVIANATVTLSDTGGGTTANENLISFEPTIATETLTLNGAGLTLRSLSTVISNANGRIITINGTADFAPGALYTGPGIGVPTVTGTLIKDGAAGTTLLLDDTTGTSNLAGASLSVFNGILSVVGDGAVNPISSLTSTIIVGTSTNGLSPVLRFSSTGGNMTFNNSFRIINTAVLDHPSATNDTIGSATSSNGLTTGKTLTVNVATGGGLTINGTMASVLNPNNAGGNLIKMGVDSTLTLPGTTNITTLNIAEGRVNIPGQFKTPLTPVFGTNTSFLSLTNPNTSAALRNALPATITVPRGTLEGIPGVFITAAGAPSTLSLTGGTLNLGVGSVGSGGLVAHLYTTGWGAAQAAFGGPAHPTNTYTDYVNYFTGIGAGTVTTTSAGGVTELSFDPGFGNTAMYQILAPTYTRTDDIVSRFVGKIIINSPGTYTFATDADDGSMLYIDGATVVSNNASQAHVRRTGTIALAAGLHDIDIGYYEGGGLNGIIVDYSGPDTADFQTTMPNAVLIPVESTIQAFLNPVTVSQNSTINSAAGASVPSVTMSATNRVLDVNGYKLDMGALTLTGGAGLYTINANTPYAEVSARSVVDGGLAVNLVNNGPGMLILESGALAQLTNGLSTVTSGALGVVLGGAGGSPTGSATVNVNGGSLMLSSKGGDQSYTPVGTSFTNGGSISAGKIGTGVAGTVGTPIRTTLTPAFTVDNSKTLTLSSLDNYILRVAGISGGGSVAVPRGRVETSGAVSLTGSGQLTVDHASLTTMAGASANAISVLTGTLTNTGALTSASTLDITTSTVSSTGTISASSTLTAISSTITSAGISVGAMDLSASTLTSSGPINSVGSVTLNASSTVTADAGGSAGDVSIANSTLNLNGGTFSGGPVTVNTGGTLSLGADDVLRNSTSSVSSVTVFGGNVTAVAGTHSTLPAVTLNGGTLGATGPGNAPTGPTINYIVEGNVTTEPNFTPSTISAPAILLRGDPANTGTNAPVTFTVPRGGAAPDLSVTSVIHDGGAGLIKNGDGIMTLAGVNTYTGPTVINAGRVEANNSSSLGTSSVTLSTGGILSLGSPPTVAGFGNVSLNGGATVDPTNTILTLTTDVGNQSRSAFTNSKYSVGDGFSASFVYTATGAAGPNGLADGITFTVQNNAPTALGGGGGGLGYLGMLNSASLQLNIYLGAGPVGTTVHSNGTVGGYISSAPVNMASGNPIKVNVVYDPNPLGPTLTETLTDLVTNATYMNTFNVPALSGFIGGNLAYVGFTGATGGLQAFQTVGNFAFHDYPQQDLTISNNVTVSAGTSGGLEVPSADPATLAGVLTLNADSILNVTGGEFATDTPYQLDVTGSTTLAGNSTIDVANNGTGLGTLHLDDVNQSGGSRSLTKTGPGTLALSGALSFAVLNSSAGTTNLDSNFTNGTINANGGTVNIHEDQTLAAVNIGAGGLVVVGGAAPAPLAFDSAIAEAAAAQAVPEPGSLSLLLLGAAGFLSRRPRERRI